MPCNFNAPASSRTIGGSKGSTSTHSDPHAFLLCQEWICRFFLLEFRVLLRKYVLCSFTVCSLFPEGRVGVRAQGGNCRRHVTPDFAISNSRRGPTHPALPTGLVSSRLGSGAPEYAVRSLRTRPARQDCRRSSKPTDNTRSGSCEKPPSRPNYQRPSG